MERTYIVVVAVLIILIIVYLYKQNYIASSTPTSTPTPTPTPTPTDPKSCASVTCTNGNTCTAGTCSCGTNTACTGSTSCVGGNCKLGVGAHCNQEQDCASGICYYGECMTSIKACNLPSDCSDQTTQDCVNGACLSKPAAYGCNPGCADGFTCESGKCVGVYTNGIPKCGTDPTNNGCPTGQECSVVKNGCATTSLFYSCSKNTDCTKLGPESVCNNGYCSCGNSYNLPISSGQVCFGGSQFNGQCGTVGSAYSGTFGALTGYTCASNGNYTCGGAICSFGQSCVNNVCK
jgi:hypothetical protein